MPTADRQIRAQRAIQDFLKQDYPDRELVILDDGAEPLLAPSDPRIRLVRTLNKRVLGPKREALVQLAQGEILVLWDDDDWHGPKRISVQIDAIRNGKEASVFGGILSYEEATGTLWETPSDHWLAPGTLAFTRKFHAYGPYPDRDVGADNAFIRARPRELLAWLDGREHYVMVRHDRHRTGHGYAGWTKLPSDRVLVFDVEVRVGLAGTARVDGQVG